MSDISSVFKVDDISTFWLDIPELIRVRTPNARLLWFKLKLSYLFSYSINKSNKFRDIQNFRIRHDLHNFAWACNLCVRHCLICKKKRLPFILVQSFPNLYLGGKSYEKYSFIILFDCIRLKVLLYRKTLQILHKLIE